jgi:hypothetical protein
VNCRGGQGVIGPVLLSARFCKLLSSSLNYFWRTDPQFELAIVHRDTRRTLCRFVGDEWSEADHPLEGESWILPSLGVLPCAMLAYVQMVRTLAHSAQSLSVHPDIAPCSAVHVSSNQHDQHASSRLSDAYACTGRTQQTAPVVSRLKPIRVD